MALVLERRDHLAQKGINRDAVLAKAVEMIERTEAPAISMRELAEKLGIKTPSLYNHVKSMDELLTGVSRRAAEELRRTQLAAIEGKDRDDALRALAGAYRRFAKEHKGLYQVTLSLPSLTGDETAEIAAAMAEPIFLVLSRYGLDREQTIHWQRVLRSIIHGFLSQEEAGFFRQDPTSAEVSYQVAVRCFLNGLHMETRGDHDGGQ